MRRVCQVFILLTLAVTVVSSTPAAAAAASRRPAGNLAGPVTAGVRVKATIPVGRRPFGIAADPRAKRIYVARVRQPHGIGDQRADRHGRGRVRVGRVPAGVATDPRTDTIYATNPRGRAIAVISGRTDSTVATVRGGFQAAFGVAADPRTNTIYLADGADQTWVISGRTDTVTAKVRVGNGTLGVATDPQAKTVYVTNNSDNTATVLASCRGRAAVRCR